MSLRRKALSSAEAEPYGEFLIFSNIGLGGRAGNDGKRERAGASRPLFSLFPSHHSPRAAAFPSPQYYRHETFTVIAA